jgi:hypothetical protein
LDRLAMIRGGAGGYTIGAAMPTLDELIRWARGYEMTPAEREAQRRSFAYGNCAIENPLVTRQMVDEVADRMNRIK